MAVDASGLLRQLDELAREKTQLLVEELADEARVTTPPTYRTGAMVAGIKSSPVSGSAPRYTAELRSESEHGVYQEFGTGPIIRKKPGGVLGDLPGFYSHRAGAVIFTNRTSGVPATRWWSRTMAKWPEIVRRVSQ